MTGSIVEGLRERFMQWFSQLPLVTRCITVLCATIYLVGLLFGTNLYTWCNAPFVVFAAWEQAYRVVTAAFVHVGFLHVLLNMMVFQGLGTSMERSIGSFNFGYFVIIFVLLTGILQDILAVILDKTAIYPAGYSECSAGFSGVLFTLLVIRSNRPGSTHTSLFGMIDVPSNIYPWVLLVVLQLVWPGVSFLGHLSGILVGYLYVGGYLDRVKLPTSVLNNLESSGCFALVTHQDAYISNPYLGSDYLPTAAQRNSNNDDAGPSLWTRMSSYMPFRLPSSSSSSSSENNKSFPGHGHVLGVRSDHNGSLSRNGKQEKPVMVPVEEDLVELHPAAGGQLPMEKPEDS